jgi:glycosyltransferase involved in cell wall biosynthesis
MKSRSSHSIQARSGEASCRTRDTPAENVRILIVTDWNRGQGGAEAYIGWLRKGLEGAGDEVRLLTSSAGTKGNGTADYVAYGASRMAEQTLLQIANPFAVRSVHRALDEFRPGVVLVNMFAHHLSPAVLHSFGSVPAVLMVTDYKCVCPIGSKLRPDGELCNSHPGWECHSAGCVGLLHWLRDQPRYALLRAGVKRVNSVIACSDLVRKALAFEGIASTFIPLPVPGPSAGYARSPSDNPVFLFCGRLDIEKGVNVLLRAFARVRVTSPKSTLRIAGRGPERERLTDLARNLDVQDAVSFLGWLPPQDIEEELARAWALVAPSVWPEPLGLVALEAIARGVPVLASLSGGFAETVEQGVSGFLVPNGDEESLASRMSEIAEKRSFADQRVPAEVVARIVAAHHIDLHTQRMRDVMTSVVGGVERTRAVS